MKAFDRLLQRWRIARAGAWIPTGSRVLDVGCGDGALFRQLESLQLSGEGIDPALTEDREWKGIRLRSGRWPTCAVGRDGFDVVTLIAVMEHIPEPEQHACALGCHAVLRPGGRAILTVPSPRVDVVAQGLQKLGLIDGMALEEHYGFDVRKVEPLFVGVGFRLKCHRTFELGFNHLWVFERGAEAGERA